MSEFCVKCVEKDANVEVLRSQHAEEIKNLNQKIEHLESLVESLTLDVSFYQNSIGRQ